MLEDKKIREDAIEETTRINSAEEEAKEVEAEMEDREDAREDEEEETDRPLGKLATFFVGVLILVSGIIVTYGMCMLKGTQPTLSMWPLAVGVDAFFLTSFGFFTSEGAAAVVYEVFCAISFICCILQTLLLF